MAIADAKKRKIGRELVEWIYLGVRTGARRAVEKARTIDASIVDPNAVRLVKMALDKPNRTRARINEWVASYDAINGAGAAQIFLGECLTLFGTVTLGQINTELTTLENWASARAAEAPAPYGNDTKTWADLASDIEAAVEHEAQQWEFPLPTGYTDIWGE